jgi:branched-chain amino acid transport system substrate-binding protein
VVGRIRCSYFKDPEDPQWAADAAMKEYKSALKKYAPKANPNDPFNVYGWAAAQTMVET